jgi:hypothetical protein
MTDIKGYIETRRDYRLRGEYDGRESLYFHGKMSLKEGLAAFEAIGKPNLIQECTKGKKVTVWHRLEGWGRLEKNLR